MGEIPDSQKNHLKYTNYPVKVVAVPIDWLMNQKKDSYSALNFLKSLIDKDNVEVFKIQSIEMIVELLFSRFRVHIYSQQIPVFVLQVICFFL
jgi:hypothetical protein